MASSSHLHITLLLLLFLVPNLIKSEDVINTSILYEGSWRSEDLPNSDVSPLPYTSTLHTFSEYLLTPHSPPSSTSLSNSTTTYKQLVIDALNNNISPTNSNLIISNIIRNINLMKNYAEIKLKINLLFDIQNNHRINSNEIIDEFLISFPVHEEAQLAGLTAIQITNEEKEAVLDIIKSTATNFNDVATITPPTIYTVKLHTPITRGGKTYIEIRYSLGRPYKPTPRSKKLRAVQTVEFSTSSQILSPYKIIAQKTEVVAGDDLTLTAKNAANIPEELTLDKNGILTSPTYTTAAPYSLGTWWRIYFVNNNPLPYFNNVKRSVTVSQFGPMYFTESYELHNAAAKLKGEFSRYDYWLNTGSFTPDMPHRISSSIVASLTAYIHKDTEKLEYFDKIGNISVSLINFKRKGMYNILKIFPRYPVYGGWNVYWQHTYRIPSQSVSMQKPDGSYSVGIPAVHGYASIYTENYTLELVFPKGAYDISVNPPFRVDSIEEGTVWSWFDILFPSPCIRIHVHGLLTKDAEAVMADLNVTYKVGFSFTGNIATVALLLIPLLMFYLMYRFIGSSLCISTIEEEKNDRNQKQVKLFIERFLALLEETYQLYASILSDIASIGKLDDSKYMENNWSKPVASLQNRVELLTKRDAYISEKYGVVKDRFRALVDALEKRLTQGTALNDPQSIKTSKLQKPTSELAIVAAEKQLWNAISEYNNKLD